MRKVTKGLLTTGLAALVIGACGDTVEVITPEPPPPAPTAVGTIPAATVAVGASSTFDAAGYFSDADGDELTYTAGSSNEAAATVSMDGSNATVTGVADGTAVITITARDPDGAAAAQGFSVTVGRGNVTNSPPTAVGTIAARTLDVGGTSTVDVSGFFSDPDGDELTYAASSSNEAVATVALDGTTVTITAVAAGEAVATISATDPDGATAAQEVSITVNAEPTNTPPAAVGTIPASTLQIGGTASVDVKGYFSDADGDELTYAASSSNESVATTALEGSTVTITAVAAGDAVITVEASDGSASVSQGFSVTVSEGPTPATVAVFGLRSLTDRNMTIDPTNVSGAINVLLDVQANDERVEQIALLLGDEEIHCRGTSSDAPPGLADSQTEYECLFNTHAVVGECSGMQLDPMYANGDYNLGARVTTSEGATRDAIVLQPITLNNSNYVMIDHNPGSVSHVVGGVTYYGGPTTEENVNTFDVCPVAFDGTVVGKIGLRGMTDTQVEEGESRGQSVSFRTHRRNRYGEYYGVRRIDDEAPFTFTALSSQNAHVEDRTADGHGGHWIIQDGVISDPDGVDISDKFVHAADDMTKIGPVYLDFASPWVTDDSEVTIEGVSIANVFYSGKRDTYDTRSQRFGISEVTERGAGGVTRVIAVGDCSVSANTDTGEKGAGTAFVAVVENAAAVGDLPEDDKDGSLSDDGGVECYTAELQSQMDRMGNATNLSKRRVQSAENFGVDKTPPAIEDLVPDEELVLTHGATLTFEVDDPDLATGEPSSGINEASPDAYWGPNTSWSQRYFYSGQADAAPGLVSLNGNVVSIDTDTGDADADKDRTYTVVAEVRDNAMPPNYANAVFSYVRDGKGPGVSLSKSPSDLGTVNTATVTVSVAGKITDSNVIETAELSIRQLVGADAECGKMDDMSHGSSGRTVRNLRDLENNTKSIEFDESFTIRKPSGPGTGTETYCFWLATEDVAGGTNGRGDGNKSENELGSFSVDWPSTPATPPGPTFEIRSGADAATATAVEKLTLTEGAAAGTYYVALKNVEDDDLPTDASPLTVELSAPSGLTLGASSLTFNTTNTNPQPVTIQGTNDRDLTNETFNVTISATGYNDAVVPVDVEDDDLMLTVRKSSATEGGDDVTFYVVATLTNARDTDLEVAWGFGGGTAGGGDFSTANVSNIDITAGDMSDSVEVTLTPTDDSEIEGTETVNAQASTPSETPHMVPAVFTIMDDDPNVTLTVTPASVGEADGATTVTVSATSAVAMSTPVDISVTFPGGDGTSYSVNGGNSNVTLTLTIDTGETESSSATVSLDPTEDTNTVNEMITIADFTFDHDNKTHTVKGASITINDNDS